MVTQDKNKYSRACDYILVDEFKSNVQVGFNGGTITGTQSVGKGILLNANGNYVTYPTNGRIMIRGTFIFDLDITFVSGSYQNICNCQSASALNYQMGIDNTASTTAKKMYWYDGTVRLSSTTVTPGRHRFAWVCDNTNVTFYMDGAIVGTAQTGVFGTTAAATITLGNAYTGTGQTANATYYGFKIAKRAYTAQEIKDDYTNSTFNFMNKMKLFFPFNDRIGTTTFTTTDCSSNGNYATLGASTAAPTKLAHRNGYSFDGGDTMTTPNNVGITGDANFSVVAWCGNINAAGTTAMVLFSMGSGASPGNKFGICVNNGTAGALSAEFSATQKTAGSQFSSTEDFMFAVTKSAGLTNATTTIYKNENSIALSSSTATAVNLGAGIGNIGCWTDATSKFTGNIYQIMVFPMELTPTQIKFLYLRGRRYNGNR